MMERKILLIIFSILIIGVSYRLILSKNGNFIFNMDNARDMVDVREMVVLKKPRLIGQTTAVDGVYYGPLWYYTISVPFILTGGHPFGSIILEIILWAVGGYFLLHLIYKFYGLLATFSVGLLWIASNFIVLATQYAFNPNPILFLTPVFIFVILKYIESGKLFFSAAAWFLAGAFLQFEITVGIFMPAIFISVLLIYRRSFIKEKNFYFGFLFFLCTLIPQALFELRHNFSLIKALIDFRSTSHGGQIAIGQDIRTIGIFKSYFDVMLPTLMNFKSYLNIMIAGFIFCISWIFIKKEKIDRLSVLSIILVLLPLISLIYLKVEIMRWHLNSTIVASIILIGFVIHKLTSLPLPGKLAGYILVLTLFVLTSKNITNYLDAAQKENKGNSIFKNEIAVIDYVYKQADGKNFKTYVYMPSVIDYPYQYLFWWRGLKKYGYLPEDYAYLPDKPQYIKQKEKLDTGTHPESSGLVFLIKEPDQIGQRHLWENSFKALKKINEVELGSIIVETRKQ